MLARTAGRRQKRHTSNLLAASFAQLNLPWLAPAQLRWSASHTAAATAAAPSHSIPRPRRKSDSKASQQAKAQIRQLATAADAYTPSHSVQLPPPGLRGSPFRNSAQDDNIPWDFSPRPGGQLAYLRPVRSPIMLRTEAVEEPATISVSKGLSGSTEDLLQHLHTSLRVGRLDRAANIVKRLAELHAPDSSETIHAHTIYMQEILNHQSRLPKDNPEQVAAHVRMTQNLLQWFEMEIGAKSVPPTAHMLVMAIVSGIRGFQGDRSDKVCRRYVEMARQLGDEIHAEVLDSEVYTDEEHAALRSATIEYYDEIESALPARQEVIKAAEEHRETMVREDKVPLSEFPQVLPTDQKGEGLLYVKKAVTAFSESASLQANATLEEQREFAYQRQIKMEQTSVELAVEKWKKADEELKKIGIATAMQSKPIGALMWQWYTALMPALEEELEQARKTLATPTSRDIDRLAYGPYLELLPLRKIAASTILHTMSIMTRGKDRDTGKYDADIKLGMLTMGLAKSLEEEAIVHVSEKTSRSSRKPAKAARSRSKIAQKLRDSKKLRTSEERPEVARDGLRGLAYTEWPSHVKVKLGAMLISKLIATAQLPVTRRHPKTKAKITQMQPAFMHRQIYKQGKRIGMFSPNPALLTKLGSDPMNVQVAKRMPMIVEPKPWTGWQSGGYYEYPSTIVRIAHGDKAAKEYFHAADQQGDMKQVYAALTALGKIPWKVHHGVLKVQIEAWNSGEEVGNFAPLNPEFQVPAEPEPSADPSPRRQWLQAVRDLENKKAGYHSKRCFQNFQLEIARAVANETLYFPHNMDFRGRAYPIPPYLNHMGADNARGLLVFGNGKELGVDGLRWLKIHVANVAGYDKASLQEREDYAMQHLEDIRDSARNALNGRRWWLESEDAWQTLAACFELTAAMELPDPTKFVSHLPIQQDGTCNGLQHYAALGGDKVGAAQVNLEPGDRPADIYSAVMNAVIQSMEKDFEKGHPIAKVLHGKITRKVVKQPVMTNVYGVTFYGAKEQVERQLKEILPEISRHAEVNHHNMALYIATKIFESLGTMFKGAQAIQTWLGTAADRISTCLTSEQIEKLTAPETAEPKKRRKKSAAPLEVTSPTGSHYEERTLHKNAKPLFRSTVVWTTPLRLPVVQPYRTTGASIVHTTMQTISLQEPQIWDPVSKRKQLQAFPPNFIHSLDATHMLLSALKCSEEGMTFASIHDSFWTHACDINNMSSVLRDAFVAMHSEDIIGRLREEFNTRYKGCMYMATILAKSPVGVEITQCRKDLRGQLSGRSGELAMEVERLRLLQSDNAENRAKGEAMVTPGSIMASQTDDAAFLVPTEMKGQKLGDIPASQLEAAVESEDLNADAEDMDMDAEVEAAEPGAAVDGEGMIEKTGFKKKPKQTNAGRKLYAWMPLTFPEVPEKGGFDVTRLRQSKYFFH